MDTKIIEYVIAIAEEKSLSKAAERLYLSQPALSQRLKKLEDELGTPLFVPRERRTFHHGCRANLCQRRPFHPADQAGSPEKADLYEPQTGQKYLTLCLRHLIRHRMHPYIS